MNTKFDIETSDVLDPKILEHNYDLWNIRNAIKDYQIRGFRMKSFKRKPNGAFGKSKHHR